VSPEANTWMLDVSLANLTQVKNCNQLTDWPVLFTHGLAKIEKEMFGGPKSPIKSGEYLSNHMRINN
jgi:hypothetical protein